MFPGENFEINFKTLGKAFCLILGGTFVNSRPFMMYSGSFLFPCVSLFEHMHSVSMPSRL